MNYSIKPALIDKPNSKELCPIKLIIIINRKRTVVATGIRVKKIQWNGSEVIGHEQAASYNAVIRKKHAEKEKEILDIVLSGRSLSVENVSKPKSQKLVPYFAYLIKAETPKRKPGTVRRYNQEYTRLEKFDKDATFASVDTAWLRRYENHLRETMVQNTVHRCFATLKKIFNAARNEGITTNYPFARYDNPKYVNPDKDYLTEKEIMNFMKAIETKPLSINMETSGWYFLLGCFSGLRLSDWLRFDKRFIQGDRLSIRAKKNGRLVTMKMHTRLKKVVKMVLKQGRPVSEQKIRVHIKAIANLAGITKDISAHTSRHSFAVLSATKGIPADVCAELMGVSRNTVMIYYKLAGYYLDKEIKKFG